MRFKVIDLNGKYAATYFRTKKSAIAWMEEELRLGHYKGANLVVVNR